MKKTTLILGAAGFVLALACGSDDDNEQDRPIDEILERESENDNRFADWIQGVCEFMGGCLDDVDELGRAFDPYGPGSSREDPHVTTLDGLVYTPTSVGEFILVSSTQDDLQIQTRTAPIADHPEKKCSDTAVNTAVAANVHGTRVAFYRDFPGQVFLDGTPRSLLEADAEPVSLPGGGTLIRSPRGEPVLVWTDGSALMVRFVQLDGLGWVNAYVIVASSRKGEVRGLLGNADGDRYNDLIRPDGTVLKVPVDRMTIEKEMLQAWAVTTQNSLFDYGAGEDTTTFTDPSHISVHPLERLTPEDRAHGEKVCGASGVTSPALLETCILDVICMGDAVVDEYAFSRPDTVQLKLLTWCETHEFEGHTYLFCNEEVGWQRRKEGKLDPFRVVRQRCLDLGMDLVTISSAAEDEFVFTTADAMERGEINGHYFIGLNDVVEEGTYVWANGEPVTFTDWAGDGPREARREGIEYDWAVVNANPCCGEEHWVMIHGGAGGYICESLD